MSKKGQGLSLNVIIVAALALIVLVVLIAIFTGRAGVFKKGVDQSSQTELIKMKIVYGSCHPTEADETTFLNSLSTAASEQAKSQTKADFRDKIDMCSRDGGASRADCVSAGCEHD